MNKQSLKQYWRLLIWVVGFTLSLQFGVVKAAELMKSSSSNRSNAVALDSTTTPESGGNIYVFVSPQTGISQVSFYLDNPTMSGTPRQVENNAPWDFAGGTTTVANPFNTASLAAGPHTITAKLTLSAGGTEVVSATFNKAAAALVFNPTTTSFTAVQGSNPAGSTVALNTNNGSIAIFSVTDDASWLTVTPTNAATPQNAVALSVNTAGLAIGMYAATVTATATGYTQATLTVNLTITPASTYGLNLSHASDRSNPVSLANTTTPASGGNIYVFVSPQTGISQVSFYLDNPTMSGTPRQVENNAPWDFAGGSTTVANPFNTASLAAGPHTITAKLTLSTGGTQVLSANFNKAAATVALAFSPDSISFSAPEGTNPANGTLSLTTNNGSVANFSVNDNVSWLTVTPSSGTTPQNAFALAVDTTGLTVGTYTATVTATATGFTPSTASVTLTVTTATSNNCPPISPLNCTRVLATLPFNLQWDQNEGKVLDGNGVGTGFTMILPSTNGTGYVPSLITTESLAPGYLQLTTNSGLFNTTTNSQDNALGVGIDASSQISVLETELIQVPTGTGGFEQAGLWYGLNEDNVHKFVVISTATGTKIQHLQEIGGTIVGNVMTTNSFNLASTDKLLLRLRSNPVVKTIAAEYSLNGGLPVAVGSFSAPPTFFNFDQAGIDPRIGTRVFGGVFASDRNGPNALTYKFDRFSLLAEPLPTPPSTNTGGDLEFVRNSYSVPFPTAMVWGADDRLYVTELFGKIHALTFNTNQQLLSDQVIYDLGFRLTLGITEDPSSTPNNVILWAAHSSGSVSNGVANSSTVSRITQSIPGTSGFDTIQHVITGLPRAIANHAINSIHFGSDGRLFIAMGGNTGAGAPNTTATEFGPRAEQPLSAALLVADVNAVGFQGICGTPGCNAGPTASCLSWVNDSNGTADNTIPASCDVSVYSSGLRNMYDFVPHSNGKIYGPDNGLGVAGSFPASPTPQCTGFASTALVSAGGQNPGAQPDSLKLLHEGQYYGHPNPQRNECVFKDGSYQNVLPLSNWEPPLLNLGNNKSADGIVEYPSNVECVAMKGNLLVTNYSLGDDITRITLSSNGTAVTDHYSLVGGFNDPLPITVGGLSGGTIFVGEFGGNKITALQPVSLGCWSNKAVLPEAILDAGGTAIGSKLYVVAGKTAANGHQTKMYIYDTIASTWAQGPNLPGVGVENPAVTTLDGKLYVFGGATTPFSGTVTNVAVFDPANASAGWQTMADMPTARSSATAQSLDGLIYVMGGMSNTGGSLDTVEIYNPVSNQWSIGPSLTSLRDNPGSAVSGGKIYIFGGRIRNANGTTVSETLNTVEMFDPVTGLWSARAPMPTGRRTMVVGNLKNRIQVMGGEITPDGKSFPQNEEYDPVTNTWKTLTPMSVPRHGAVAGTIGDTIYVTGGGPTGGTAYTNNTAAFKF